MEEVGEEAEIDTTVLAEGGAERVEAWHFRRLAHEW